MSIFTGQPSVFSGSPLTTNEAAPSHALGEKMFTPDGRAYRYVKVGALALVVGNVLQGIAEDTGEQGLTPVAADAGALTITTSAITVTKDQYAGGFVIVTVTPGLGYQYKIKSHPASTAAACVITLEDPIQVALTTTSRIDLVPNIYSGVIQSLAATSDAIVGVAVCPITALYYGWIQTNGVASVLADGALAVGDSIFASDNLAGGAESGVNAATEALPYIGVAVTGVATGECGAVKLCID